jgi:O-methyltransferase involved in polyketide biosynthesis
MEIDLRNDRAHSARIYDYILGGKDNYPADRAAAEEMLRVNPSTRTGMLANRAFLRRVVHALAADYGIGQFLDLGTGIPTSPNVHEVAQAVDPGCRVVYADNDPIVLAHARALLSGTPQGRTVYVEADMRDSASILRDARVLEVIDPSRPAALVMVGVAHLLSDQQVQALVDGFTGLWPSGSFVALQILTADYGRDVMLATQRVYRSHGQVMNLRAHEEALQFVRGLQVQEPGLVQMHMWRPDVEESAGLVPEADVGAYGVLARTP